MGKFFALKVLLALVLGLAAGIAISQSGNPDLARAVGWIEPVGTLWINAVRMTVIPLVVGAIIVGISSVPDLKTLGSLGGKVLVLFLLVLIAAATFGVLLAQPAFSYLSIDPAAAASLRQGAAQASAAAVESAQKIPSLKQWLIDFVPANPIKAAADGAMLPLIVFLVPFGIALTRVSSPARDTFLNVARAMMEASLTLVRWILMAAPIAIFALSVPLALKLGVAAAGAVLFFLSAEAIGCLLFMALLYVVVVVATPLRLRALLRWWAPAQTVGFSSRSSMVALPAMIEVSETMRQPLVVRSFLLPLAVALFRAGSAIYLPIAALFIARLYGVELGPAQLVAITLTSVVTTFSIPSVPSGTVVIMVPVLMSANLPIEGIGVLMAVDTLPDMFRTMTHVTGDMTVAAIVSRSHEASVEVSSVPAAQT
jgi:Na+/H+-dicarboxylate symporter